ncbi:hypothetical protein BDN67DRAFT_321708 [Paxillus ammoniavirescens]|nr:hypothetical protein BDN67DRAFT_321708 [Paxillus ammoniavirescens]
MKQLIACPSALREVHPGLLRMIGRDRLLVILSYRILRTRRIRRDPECCVVGWSWAIGLGTCYGAQLVLRHSSHTWHLLVSHYSAAITGTKSHA